MHQGDDGVGETGPITIAVTVPTSAASGVVNNLASVSATTPDPPLREQQFGCLGDRGRPGTTDNRAPCRAAADGVDSTLPFVLAPFGLIVGGLALLLGGRRRTDH